MKRLAIMTYLRMLRSLFPRDRREVELTALAAERVARRRIEARRVEQRDLVPDWRAMRRMSQPSGRPLQ